MKIIFQTRKKGSLLATLFVPSRTICLNFGNPVRTGATLLVPLRTKTKANENRKESQRDCAGVLPGIYPATGGRGSGKMATPWQHFGTIT